MAARSASSRTFSPRIWSTALSICCCETICFEALAMRRLFSQPVESQSLISRPLVRKSAANGSGLQHLAVEVESGFPGREWIQFKGLWPDDQIHFCDGRGGQFTRQGIDERVDRDA